MYNSIINNTPISYKANRKIGGDAPSVYLSGIQNHEQVQIDNEVMDAILESHYIPHIYLRANNFQAFYEQRKNMLLGLISNEMGREIIDADE